MQMIDGPVLGFDRALRTLTGGVGAKRPGCAVVARMRDEEARHGEQALASGGVEFSRAAKRAMTLLSRLMTEAAYRL